MDCAIDVRGVSKRYGDTVAVSELSFSVQPGRVTAFVGPNGAGKSTTMRMILGLDEPDAGEILVSGRRYRELTHPLREVGALLDATAVHPGRRARNHLLWQATSNGLAAARVDEVLELVGLSRVAKKRVGGFSLGMSQRLGIAGALLGDPPVLMFDEPINGLDPEGIRWIRGLMRSLAAEGRTVFVSSHLMSELEGTADEVVVIGRGRLLAATRVDDLIAGMSDGKVLLRTPQPADVMTLLARSGGTVTSTDDGALTVTGLEASRIADLTAEHGLRLYELTPQRTRLEEAFIELTRDAVEFRGEADQS